MLKKSIVLLLLIAQASIQAADQTKNAETPQSINIDIKNHKFALQSTISVSIPDDPTFAELQIKLNQINEGAVRIENGLRYHAVDYNHPDYDFLIDAHSKVKDSNWGRSSYGCNLIAYLPQPSSTQRAVRKVVV